MKTIEFQDMENHAICCQYSSGGNIRVYIKHDGKNGHDPVDACLHMTATQAKIMILALEDLVEGAE